MRCSLKKRKEKEAAYIPRNTLVHAKKVTNPLASLSLTFKISLTFVSCFLTSPNSPFISRSPHSLLHQSFEFIRLLVLQPYKTYKLELSKNKAFISFLCKNATFLIIFFININFCMYMQNLVLFN